MSYGSQDEQDELDILYKLIDDGRLGLNIGISTGLPKLDDLIGGVQRGTFYLVAGDTGSGKTSLCLYSLIYKPLRERLGDKTLKIVYYSLEMSKEMLLTKLLSVYLYDTYGIQLTYNQILSRNEVLQDEYYEKVLEARAWLNQIVTHHLTVYDKMLTTSHLYAHLKSYSEKHGTYKKSKDGLRNIYTPKVENQYTIVILDHVWLLNTMAGQSKKDAADTAADYLITFRRVCNFTPVVLQQLNRQAGSMDRRNAELVMPELQDLKGTGGVGEASDVVLALFNPFRQKRTSWSEYNIEILRDKFRAIVILKSRFGESEKAIPVSFFGNINSFLEIPEASQITDFRQYLNIDTAREAISKLDLNRDSDTSENEDESVTLPPFSITI